MPCFPKEWSGPCPALCPGRAAAGEAGHWPLNHAMAHFPLESTFNCSHAIKPSASKIELWLFLFVLFPWEGLRQGQEVWMGHQICAGGLGDHSVVCGLWITFISIAWEPGLLTPRCGHHSLRGRHRESTHFAKPQFTLINTDAGVPGNSEPQEDVGWSMDSEC